MPDEPDQPTEPNSPAASPPAGGEGDTDKTIPAERTAPGVGDAEIGGESLDP